MASSTGRFTTSRPRSSPRLAHTRYLPLAALALSLSGCTWVFLAASSSVATGGVASYTVELHNDEADPSVPIATFTVAHVPTSWSFHSGTFTATTAPHNGTGTVIADPGFLCDFGPNLPDPTSGQQRIVVSWATFDDVGNPESGAATHRFAVGSETGDHTVTFFFVAQGAGQTLCSTGISEITRVEVPIFADGFETGDTSAW